MQFFLSQGILSDILKCLGDNKKHMRECTLTTLDLWLAAVHLDKMVGFCSFCILVQSCSILLFIVLFDISLSNRCEDLVLVP